MDEGKGFIVCKNRVKYRTNVAISPKNRKDVGCLAWKICGFEIDASFYFIYHKPGFVIKRPVYFKVRNMEEQGKRERVMDNGDSHIATHIPYINTIHKHIHTPHSHAL